MIKNMPQLTSLSLPRCMITPASLKLLQYCCPKLKTLRLNCKLFSLLLLFVFWPLIAWLFPSTACSSLKDYGLQYLAYQPLPEKISDVRIPKRFATLSMAPHLMNYSVEEMRWAAMNNHQVYDPPVGPFRLIFFFHSRDNALSCLLSVVVECHLDVLSNGEVNFSIDLLYRMGENSFLC
jgi:hypothetical protein